MDFNPAQFCVQEGVIKLMIVRKVKFDWRQEESASSSENHAIN
jgi:hypothetical protein